MLHVTAHFDAGDLDKYNTSPMKKANIVYHSKRRFPSIENNMHYGTTFEAVGRNSGGDPELENMRFRTTHRDEHSNEKV